jgi:hypothetical protein
MLRDRLGRHLVGLDVRRGTSLRALGLAHLTRGLVRWTRHRWSRRRGTCRWSGSRSAGRWLGEDEQHRIRWEPETRSGVEDSRRRCALVIGPRVIWERELGYSELHRVCPEPLSSFCIRVVRQGPTTISWLAPPIRARDQTGLRLGLIPLDARWGQSNRKKRLVAQSDRRKKRRWGYSLVGAVSILFWWFSLISDEFWYETSCIGKDISLPFYTYVECKKMEHGCNFTICFSMSVTVSQ